MYDYTQSQWQKLVERVLQGAPKETTFVGIDTFLQRYFADVPPEDLLGRDADSLRAMAIGHAEFAHKRTPMQPLVRIFNPTIATHGWHSTHTIVEVVTDDMPFLVDSVSMALNRCGLTVHLTIHPLIRLRRDDRGNLTDFLGDGDDPQVLSESFLHVEIDCETDQAEIEKLRTSIEQVLADVAAAIGDWQAMRERVSAVRELLPSYPENFGRAEISEAQALLDWLLDNHFTFLGYREYDLITEDGNDILRIVPDSGLGIMRHQRGSGEVSAAFAVLPAATRAHARDPNLVILTKGNARATVHRPGYIDYVGIKRVDKDGAIIGEFRIIGLYTSTAYSSDPNEIPIVRRTLQQISQRSGLQRGSHADKALQTILRNYPRDELFQIEPDLLFDHALGILHLQERQRLKLFVRPDFYGRFMSCLVFLARDRYDTNMRQRLEAILMRAFRGTGAEFNTMLGESVLARIHFIIYTDPNDVPDIDVKALELDLVEAARSWQERLSQALNRQYGEERGNYLLKNYQAAFPAGYQDDFSAAVAVRDINHIEQLEDERSLELDLYRIPGDPPRPCACACIADVIPFRSLTSCPSWRTWACGSSPSGLTTSTRANPSTPGCTISAWPTACRQR